MSVAYFRLPVVEDVITLLLRILNDCLVLHDNDVYSFTADISQTRVCLHRVQHVRDLLKSAAECVELAKDIVLTVNRK